MAKRAHADLRRAVLDASVDLVEEGGIGALSMREVARRAGVTHGAPYHHFVDRAAILAAIAEEGFHLLATTMRAAVEAVPASDPRGRFEASGCAYFEFALAHPAHFRVMFRPELADRDKHPALDQSGAAAFLVLIECVQALQAAHLAPPGDVLPLVLTGWSTAHGLAALWVDGPLSRGLPGLSADRKTLVAMVSKSLGHLFAAAGTLSRVTELGASTLGPRER